MDLIKKLYEEWPLLLLILGFLLFLWFGILKSPWKPQEGIQVWNWATLVGFLGFLGIFLFLWVWLAWTPEKSLRTAGFSQNPESGAWLASYRANEFILPAAQKASLARELGPEFKSLDPEAIDYRIVSYSLPTGDSITHFFVISAIYTGKAKKTDGQEVPNQSVFLKGYASSISLTRWLEGFTDGMGANATARNTRSPDEIPQVIRRPPS